MHGHALVTLRIHHCARNSELRDEASIPAAIETAVKAAVIALFSNGYRWYLEKNATQMPAVSWRLTPNLPNLPKPESIICARQQRVYEWLANTLPLHHCLV